MLDAKERSPGAGDAGAVLKCTHSEAGELREHGYSGSRADATQERAPEAAFLADALLGVCDRLRRLSPDHRNPDHFHEEKSELEGQLRSLSKAVRQIGGAA